MNEYAKESSGKRVRKRQMLVTEWHTVTGIRKDEIWEQEKVILIVFGSLVRRKQIEIWVENECVCNANCEKSWEGKVIHVSGCGSHF